MMLLLDIGNTNLRWTPWTEQGFGEIGVVRHDGGIPLDLLASWEGLAPRPRRLLVSNVGGAAVAAALTRVSRAYWGIEPEFAATRARWGRLRIAYDEPSRLGVDRWLGLVAAEAEGEGAKLILDAGTAVTFDLLAADGEHLGGVILPGIEMMRASLLAGTAIPRITAEPVGEPWARDTGTAVAAGSLQAVLGVATRLYDQFAARIGTAPRLLLTGGDAPRLGPLLERPWEAVPDLVLRGLARVGGTH
ncbi:type III pantothenate kinase [Marichromatium bheemlicum]|uniref:Type III pantothenate kinase n=1 Tax=Marichromatium bheemlicum TaxID=365339 RepID=A0ABX1I7N4_9GAMM|nr:type III pantothenate kinase [Marichromatium bheemlicum]NKN32410.1 type III pantothenate kinase [Marichromatium bheemlicum]